jgi:sulfite dehydrogenase (quinone) subunit SoeC
MLPAFSVVFLTTLIGAGQGLLLALYLAEFGARYRGWLAAPAGDMFFAIGATIAVGLTAAGLVASVFHLGRPERGWRAAARWRTSWLSREVIVLPAFMAATTLYGAGHFAGMQSPQGAFGPTLAIGAIAALLALVLYLCTAMIYACLKFLQEWASPLTIANYFLLGSASGFTLAAAYAAFAAPALVVFFATWAVMLTIAALLTRSASLVRNARLKPKSTLQSAIGIKHPRIAQKSMGMMGGAFNTREFFHGRTRTLLRRVKWTFLILVFPIPIALLLAGIALHSAAWLAAAFVTQYAGLLAERWFFFAQANHPQNLYYQTVA